MALRSRLSPGLSSETAGPVSPPSRMVARLVRRSPPRSFLPPPWHLKQFFCRIGRASFSKRATCWPVKLGWGAGFLPVGSEARTREAAASAVRPASVRGRLGIMAHSLGRAHGRRVGGDCVRQYSVPNGRTSGAGFLRLDYGRGAEEVRDLWPGGW